MNSYHPDDRPDPAEQPIRARVPEHVSSGAFSTGVIVMTAQTEFILDFVQNLGRPHQIVARIIMPHHVLPQLVDALQRNIELYRNRWGDLPGAAASSNATQTSDQPADNKPAEAVGAAGSGPGGAGGSGAGGGAAGGGQQQGDAQQPPGAKTRTASAQEVYDDLKIRDELLSGSYANAVMIGHGAHEFSFDFITNFYPHSAVSARVFLSAGQVPRLYDSLKGTWEQMQAKRQPPPPGQANPGSADQPPQSNDSGDDSQDGGKPDGTDQT